MRSCEVAIIWPELYGDLQHFLQSWTFRPEFGYCFLEGSPFRTSIFGSFFLGEFYLLKSQKVKVLKWALFVLAPKNFTLLQQGAGLNWIGGKAKHHPEDTTATRTGSSFSMGKMAILCFWKCFSFGGQEVLTHEVLKKNLWNFFLGNPY